MKHAPKHTSRLYRPKPPNPNPRHRAKPTPETLATESRSMAVQALMKTMTRMMKGQA